MTEADENILLPGVTIEHAMDYDADNFLEVEVARFEKRVNSA